MNAYVANKATEFTKKQISVIYGMAKKNELTIERWVMSRLYDLAEYYGYDDNGSVAYEETKILNILNKVFSNDLSEAQKMIDAYTEETFQLLSSKYQKMCNRDIVA